MKKYTAEELRKAKAGSDAFYDRFIRVGLASGFTDDQIDFLWDFIAEMSLEVTAEEDY